MTAANGIEAAGAYAPRYRVTAEAFEQAWGQFHASGVSQKAVPDADEDALTMAYEAGRRALGAADRDGSAVAFLAVATTTPPLEEEELTPRLASTLGVPATATHRAFGASTRAGTRALAAGLDADLGGEAVGLVVAADCPRGEPDSSADHAAGAGAAAFVLSADGAAVVRDRAEYAAAYPGTRFRRRGSDRVEGLGATSYERRAFTDPLAGAVERLDFDAPDAVAVQAPDGKLPYRAAGALGVDTDAVGACATVHDLGDAGAASVPLGLAVALDSDATAILAAGWGSGAGADALAVEVRGEVPTALALDGDEQLSYAEYLRRRGELTSGPPAGGGAYVSVPSWRRTLTQRHRLVAGRCPDCGALAFPPEGACVDCGALADFEPVELPGTGTVEAATVISQGGAPPEFAEQQAQSGEFAVAIVALDGVEDDAETVSVPAQVTATDPGAVAIGDRVEATVRRVYEQEGVTRYGCKVRPSERCE